MMILVLLPVSPCFGGEEELEQQVRETIDQFKKTDPGMKEFFNTAHGYAVFPTVGRAGIGLGGPHGTGLVYEGGERVGVAKLTQGKLVFQLGGQAYSEVIFLENEETMERFKESDFSLSFWASAVPAAAGASANAKYRLGVVVFTVAKGGLTYEASVGGQTFKFIPR
jgi:lipid-binding SYLF domain-containing protein